MIKRFLYLGYYIKKMDWEKFWLFLNYTAEQTKRSKLSILYDVFTCVFIMRVVTHLLHLIMHLNPTPNPLPVDVMYLVSFHFDLAFLSFSS